MLFRWIGGIWGLVSGIEFTLAAKLFAQQGNSRGAAVCYAIAALVFALTFFAMALTKEKA